MDVSRDRRQKYGWGALRMAAVLTTLALINSNHFPAAATGWMVNAYLGFIGAVVNVDIAPRAMNLAMLSFGALLLLWRVGQADFATVIILLKTLGGDYLAGKIDTLEWKQALAFAIALPCCWLGGSGHYSTVQSLMAYGRIFPILFAIQFISEYGDNHWEHLKLFRHRYAFEALSLGAVFLQGPAPHELRVIWLDLFQCFCYRLCNWLIILSATADGATYQMPLCWMPLCCDGTRIQGKNIMRVRDPHVAKIALKSSTTKGFCLEKCIATPAWAPILSLESIDGDLWQSMRADFGLLHKLLPPASKMQEVSRQLAKQLAASNSVITADEVVRFTLEAFILYLFDRKWCPAFEVFAEASWQWRKEIAARGKADPAIKQAAIDVLVQDLLPGSTYWSLFAERWHLPQYYSLILQPFIISPAINVSDIAVAMHRHPGASLDYVIRVMHPIPILERFVDHDILLDGRVVVPAGTQAMIFTSDIQHSAAWSPFGEGIRQCPGAFLARPLLLAVQQELLQLQHFKPEQHHRYSGRNNDGHTNLQEVLYFVKLIGCLIGSLVWKRLRG